VTSNPRFTVMLIFKVK